MPTLSTTTSEGSIEAWPEDIAGSLSLRQKLLRAFRPSRRPPRPPCFEDHFQLGVQLGKGAYGRVYAARVKNQSSFGRNPIHFACKILSKEGATDEGIAVMKMEPALLGECQHENVVQLVAHFETSARIYAVMTRCYGDVAGLQERLQAEGCPLRLDMVAKWSFQLCRALAHCHGNEVIHRDVKGANLLLRAPGSESDILLGDFGFACKFAAPEGILGTPLNLSPEVLCGARQAPACDAWAAGLTMYEMVNGCHPFMAAFRSRRCSSEAAGVVETLAPRLRARFQDLALMFNSGDKWVAKFERMAVLVTNKKFVIPFDTPRLLAAPLLRDVVQQLVRRDRCLVTCSSSSEIVQRVTSMHVDERPRVTMAEAVAFKCFDEARQASMVKRLKRRTFP